MCLCVCVSPFIVTKVINNLILKENIYYYYSSSRLYFGRYVGLINIFKKNKVNIWDISWEYWGSTLNIIGQIHKGLTDKPSMLGFYLENNWADKQRVNWQTNQYWGFYLENNWEDNTKGKLTVIFIQMLFGEKFMLITLLFQLLECV